MARPLKPLTADNATGNGIASTTDLVRLSSSVLGAVNQFGASIGEQYRAIDEKLDGVCTQVDTIKTERRVEAALAVERTRTAEKTAKDAAAAETQHANKAAEERHDQTAAVASNILSRHWRITLLAGIATSIALSLANFLVRQ